ncbi:YobI family P-loop NTPase [Phytohabitans kaempferiae]|uniref:YobI-like P-loop NTPase domain-containing protein n=1 Tax=Phytohabitans kaempferiae TaxID=1620943 RepID=A0ABV6MBB2_9ACTN
MRWWERLRAWRVGTSRSADGDVALLPLTPQFQPEQHEEYVVRLTAALQEPDVRNIALTGRYGAGKSSVLKAFTDQHTGRVLNLSLSTLGPSEDEQSITNRIEKELVKQLLHSQPQRTLPRSHFRRIDKPNLRRAVAFATTQVAVVALILFLLGRFPRLPGATKDHPWPVRAGTVLLFGLLMVAVLTWIRQVIHNRVVSSVSAAGATVALEAVEVSYFDKYLDEIVYFFESTNFDIVVFEDLDRFDDPHIFEALRELNTLLNTSHAARGRTIRFVYALKDSIFERLGNDTMQLDDGASAESVRANRTKFFDLVVPVVPFITHRTSRDLLTQLLADPALVPVTPELVDLVARHISDMRLLKNIRNEYAVFAARLITAKHGVPQLRADSVFAMMVYKNVHLADFEQVSLGRSDLDKLYKLSRDLVNQSIARRRDRLSKIAASEALAHVLREKPERFGQRLNWHAEVIRRSGNNHHYTLESYMIGAETFTHAQAGTVGFWRALIAEGNGLTANFRAAYQSPLQVHISEADIRELFRGELDLDDWDSREREALDAEREAVNAEITVLRKADFTDLAANPAFTLDRDSAEVTFEAFLGETIRSEVARDLIRRGFIDQNFALYVAQYYGERVSIRAMNFIVQHVQPNVPDTYYAFNGPDDIAGVLRETNADFLDLNSAYNIEILDHLLANQHPGARTVLNRLTEIDGPVERAFLPAYLSGGAQAAEAVRRLSATWPPILSRILQVPDLQPERRLDLVDEAVAHADPNLDRQIEEQVTTYLQDNYARLDCLTRPVNEPSARNAVALLGQAQVVIDDLTVLDHGVRALVVVDSRYTLTAGNLRSALHNPPALSLDTVRAIDPTVYGYCIANPAAYLTAVENDEPTTVTVADPGTFADIVTEIAGWETGLAERACRAAATECRIERLGEVPAEVWPVLARSRRFPATVTNTAAYIEQTGGVDNDLAGLLVEAGAITAPAEEPDQLAEQKTQVAVTILRSRETIPAPETRAALVATLALTESIAASRVEPENGPLLGELLRHQICDDTAELFQQFATSGWETLRHGIECSAKFADYVTPALLDEAMTARLLGSASISHTVRQAVLSRLDEFVPSDHRDALRAAGRFAAAAQVPLSPAQLERIAWVTRDAALVVLLVDQLGNAISTDQIIAVLANLGSPYADLATPAASPTFPDDTHLYQVLNRLKQEGRLSRLSRRRTKSQITATVA